MPWQVKEALRDARSLLRRWQYRGSDRFCPVCEKAASHFATFGLSHRKDAACVYCHSLERHRLAWLYFQRCSNLFDGSGWQMLHVAPETMFRKILKKNVGAGYLTADLNGKGVDIAMDITDIQYPDNTFDIIYCSHVLEHVPDDRRAMREFRRVLKPDGWAVILVPITADKTHEDPSLTDSAERLRRFGQEDHVREYGPDYVDRLREAGFRVEVVRGGDFLDAHEIERMGITPAAGEIYVCKKN